MKRMGIIFAAGIFALIAVSGASANGRLSIHGDYNAPVSTTSIGSNLEFGAQYRFWGIFLLEGSIFTNINYGADNIFNIESITPIGLFSTGFGMRIPLGGLALELGWNQFYTGFANSGGVYHFSDSYNIGVAIDLSRRFGVRVYSRSLYNFTPQAVASQSFGVTYATEKVTTLGAGVVLHLF